MARTLRQAVLLSRNKVPAQAIVPLNRLIRLWLLISPPPRALNRHRVLSILPLVLRTARRQPTRVTPLLVPEIPRPVTSPLPPKTGRVNEVKVRSTNLFGPVIATFELPAYFVRLATPKFGQKVVCVEPAAQQVVVSATLVTPMLGWPLNNRTGIFVVSLLGTIRLLNASCLTARGVPVNSIVSEPLALCIRCPKLTNEVLIRRSVVCTRVIVVLAATLVTPTVLTICMPLPQTVVALAATLIRWLSTSKEQHIPVTL